MRAQRQASKRRVEREAEGSGVARQRDEIAAVVGRPQRIDVGERLGGIGRAQEELAARPQVVQALAARELGRIVAWKRMISRASTRKR
jgi:hypothetical protein